MSDIEPRRFLVVGPLRSGSNHVIRSLGAHPDIARAPGEIRAWPLFALGADAFVNGGIDHSRLRHLSRLMFDSLCEFDVRPHARAIGGKVALADDLEALDLVVGLQDFFEDLLIVRLHRDDLVSRFASRITASRSGRWWLEPGETRELATERLPVAEFREFVAAESRLSGILDELYRTHDVIDLRFEDFAASAWAADVFEALGLEQVAVPSSRRSTPPVDAWVENVEQLRGLVADLPDPASLAIEVEQHRQERARRDSPFVLVSRARYYLETGRPIEARQMILSAMWRPLTPMESGHAFRLLGRALRRIGNTELASRTVESLRPRWAERAPFLALAARQEAMLGNLPRVRQLVDQARPLCDESATRAVLAEVREELAAAEKGAHPVTSTARRSRPRRFLVVAPQRAGASTVAHALAAREEIAMRVPEVRPWPLLHRGLEAFSSRALDLRARRRAVKAAFDALTFNPTGMLPRGLQMALPNGRDAIEAVIGLADHLDEALVIRIRRSDLVACFAERVLAEKNPLWAHGATPPAPGAVRRRFDPQAFEVFAASQRRVTGCLELIGIANEVVTVDYDDDIARWSGLPGVASALGLGDGGLPEPRWRRPLPVADLVENLDELRAIEAATPAVDMVPELEGYRARAGDFEPIRMLIRRAQGCLRDLRPADAAEVAVEALRRPTAVGSPAAQIGFAVLERAWRELADVDRARRGVEDLLPFHGADAGFLCLQAAFEAAAGNPAAALEIAERALAQRTELPTTEFLRLRELLDRLRAG